MRLLLDEMWPAGIASALRARGHDVQAVTERSDLRGQADDVLFAVARHEGRALVTENVTDFRPIAHAILSRGGGHCGLIFTTNHRFPRRDSRTVGRLVTALDELIRTGPMIESTEHWLV